jgi:hypothetical protein
MLREARKALKTQKAFHRKWLLKPGVVAMRADDEKDIEEDRIRGDSPASLLMISDRLMRLASWYGANGQVALMDGNMSGWLDIHRSWLYLCLCLRTRISVFQKG